MSYGYDIVGAEDLLLAGEEFIGADDVSDLLSGYEVVGANPFAMMAQRSRAAAPFRRRAAAPARRANPFAAALAAKQAQAGTLLRTTQPNHSNRLILPMSSSAAVAAAASATVTARPQAVAYRAEKLIVGGTPDDWTINDIKVGNRSQFAQAGSIPASAFASTALGNEVSFETVQAAWDFVIQVTNNGAAAASFQAVVFGTTVQS